MATLAFILSGLFFALAGLLFANLATVQEFAAVMQFVFYFNTALTLGCLFLIAGLVLTVLQSIDKRLRDFDHAMQGLPAAVRSIRDSMER